MPIPILIPQAWLSPSFCLMTAFAKFTILQKLEEHRAHPSLRGATRLGLIRKRKHVPVTLGPLVNK